MRIREETSWTFFTSLISHVWLQENGRRLMLGCDRVSSVLWQAACHCSLLLFLSFLYFTLHHTLFSGIRESRRFETLFPSVKGSIIEELWCVFKGWNCMCVRERETERERERERMCVCERERETIEDHSLLVLPVTLTLRTFNACPSVSLSFFGFDDLDNEDKLLGAHWNVSVYCCRAPEQDAKFRCECVVASACLCPC